MARRRVRKIRRQGAHAREPIGGRCVAEDCPYLAVAEVYVADAGRDLRLCEQHALAVEMQKRRNEEAAKARRREETEEKLGIR